VTPVAQVYPSTFDGRECRGQLGRSFGPET
jgi:hypothetical protein